MRRFPIPISTYLDKMTGRSFQLLAEERGITESELAREMITMRTNDQDPRPTIGPEIEFLLREYFEMRNLIYTCLSLIAVDRKWGDDRIRETVERTRESAHELASKRVAEANRELERRALGRRRF